jgi:hypothetical protein
LTILADELTDYEFATDENGESLDAQEQPELPGFDVIRCWKFNSMATPVRLLNTIRKLKPDVVWFNLVFSSFATPEYPVAAFAGLSVPALTRAWAITPMSLCTTFSNTSILPAPVSVRKRYSVLEATWPPEPFEGKFRIRPTLRVPAHFD